MLILNGKGVSNGLAFGKVYYFDRAPITIARTVISDPAAELVRFSEAKAAAIAELEKLYAHAAETIGEKDAEIFSVHQMMLDDLDYCESIQGMIQDENICAEFAVNATADIFADMFAALDDPYMKARATDVRDISRRVIGILSGKRDTIVLNEPSIIATDDLTPSETVTIDRNLLLAIITSGGSSNSHTAILSRTMGIPAIISLGEGLTNDIGGKQIIVDADSGTVYVEPDKAVNLKMHEKHEEFERQRVLLHELVGEENITLDGKKIEICANIGSPADLPLVKRNDAGGIGLFRSEFLYLESKNYPSEDSQFEAYKSVLEAMDGKRVVIRTLDIGADKKIGYFKLPKEENPALGFRAIRICLERPEIFKTQLRALLRASVYGRLSVMFPMITSKSEIDDIKKLLAESKDELKAKGIPFSEQVEYGIMIETPAAAIISDLLAKEVDFFSVGTNDLTQYTLAADRQNASIERFINKHHEAVLRLIEFAARSIHAEGKWIGICGELGADTALTKRFLEMGIDELSVSPSKVLEVRNMVRHITVD
ncbi:MAG: phosphoenolpyruvate--protein phosphotransferase [Oscillospiraceae bacterium]